MGDFAEDYISTACRFGRHVDCQEHQVVSCACPCHGAPAAGQRSDDLLWSILVKQMREALPEPLEAMAEV